MGNTINNFMRSRKYSLSDNDVIQTELMHRPVGILRKNYDYLKSALLRNIGNGVHYYDGIGEVSEIDNDRKPAWFYIDQKKMYTSNYIDYINKTYFNDNGGIVNNFIDAVTKTLFFNHNSLLLENNQVGVIRGYYVDNLINGVNGEYSKTNPNSLTDTRLGSLNDFYLNETLFNSRNVYNEKMLNGNSITDGIYSLFGFDGKMGMEVGHLHQKEGRVMSQNELLGDTIAYTPFDNEYTFFGNFYGVDNSYSLLNSTSYKFNNFIAKSMYGFDLLDERYDDVSLFKTPLSDKTPKKYYVNNETRGHNYIDTITNNSVEYDLANDEKNILRLKLDAGNSNCFSSRHLYSYGEAEGNTDGTPKMMKETNSYNSGIEYGSHVIYSESNLKNQNDIISYTNKKFLKGKYDTLIARFHSNKIENVRDNKDITSTAISKYGMSHGRNLLKVKSDTPNGYDNPYCRVWTYHHQYHSLRQTIRPFIDEQGNPSSMENTAIEQYRSNGGIKKLEEYGVKGSNRLVRFAPTEDLKSPNKNNVKNCMFSIENLAWKGEKNFFKGHEDQKGPLGGRIMWFPPYDLRFNENVDVNWSQNQFIGRGESIYTYTNTERSGQLSFKLLIDHPSIINQWVNKGSDMGGENIGDVDDINSKEQQLLRFFAGCEILQAKAPETANKQTVPTIKKEVQPIETQPISVVTDDELVFYVFYPNNYSGVDDDPNGVVKPMEYLVNGIYANKYLYNNKIFDYATTFFSTNPGYEMSKSVSGISSGSTEYTNTGTTLTTILGKQNNVEFVHQYVPSNKNGKPNYWAYRCDKAYENQVLHTFKGFRRINYYDSNTYGLNSVQGVGKIVQVHTNDKYTYEKGRLFSFADVFCAIQPEGASVLSESCNADNVKIISEILGLNKKGYTIKGVNVKGFASSHGYNSTNDVLGMNRARSVVKWLKKQYPEKFNVDFKYEVNEIGAKISNYDVNSFEAKIWRCSRVAIQIQKTEVLNKSELTDFDVNVNNNNALIASNYTYTTNQVAADLQKETHISSVKSGLSVAYTRTNDNTIKGSDIYTSISEIKDNNNKAEQSVINAQVNGDATNIQDGVNYGYKDEYKFFSELGINEPFMHSKLVDKIRYFDPAFHSITPEGFQSRLTFLHQCTRQGNTSAATDVLNKNRTANNLAFGRPPICVLRIGDFYNTKILITNLSINYDETTWDLNEEGIGVMPMMASITLSFKFLGGSDLTGPINRLQNALSFNHYANTGVYDNRAEEVEYDDKGELINFKFKS